MPQQVVEVSTVEEAREVAAQNGGTWYVVDADTLRQIEESEAAGGYQGGQSGSSDGAPYSLDGEGALDSSDGSAPVEPLDLEGAWSTSQIVQIGSDLLENIMDLADVIDAAAGEALGPVLVVPTRELQRLLGTGPADDA